ETEGPFPPSLVRFPLVQAGGGMSRKPETLDGDGGGGIMQGVRRGRRTIRAGLMAGVCLGAAAAAHAGDATWSAAPPNNNWNDGANWTSIPPHAVPDGT